MDNPELEALVQGNMTALAEGIGDLYGVANGQNETGARKMLFDQRNPERHQSAHARVFDQRTILSEFVDEEPQQFLLESACHRALKMLAVHWGKVTPVGADGIQKFLVQLRQGI